MSVFRIFLVGFLFNLLLGGPVAATVITNGDFSASPAFTGWERTLVVTGPIAAGNDNHLFTLPAEGGAKISNYSTDWWAALSQTITIPALAQTLSFDFEWFFTYDDAPEVQAALWDTSYTTAIDLFSGIDFFNGSSIKHTNSGTATTDISSLVGETFILDFLVYDNDSNETDWLKINNVTITVIPEPGTMALFAMGLLVGSRIARRKSRS